MNEINTLEISEKSQSFASANSDIILPKQTYRILGSWYMYALTIVFLVIGFTFLILGIKDLIDGEDFNIHNFILFAVLIIIACIITYFFPFYASITIDMLNRSIVVKKYPILIISKFLSLSPSSAKIFSPFLSSKTKLNPSSSFVSPSLS